MDRLEQFPPIWTVLDDYPLFDKELAPEMTLSEILDDFDRWIAPPTFFHDSIPYEPSMLFWSQPPPTLVTAPRTAVAGLRRTPTFGTLTHGIDPREFLPFVPPTCPVPFASPFSSASDVSESPDQGVDSPSSDAAGLEACDACDSGYESDVPPPRPAEVAEFTFRAPVLPTLPVVPTVVRPREVEVRREEKLSEKALGKRRAMDDDVEEEEEDEPPRKRWRESDDDDSDYLYDSEDFDSDFGSPSVGSAGPSTVIPRARASPAAKAAPRAKARHQCLFRTCNEPGERLEFGSWKDRNRHMETHRDKDDKALLCPNPACTSKFDRLDALRRHCLASKSKRCARFWREGTVQAVRLPFYLTCPLEELVVPDKNDPLYEMRWA